MAACIVLAILSLPSLLTPVSSKLAQDAQKFAASQQFHAQTAGQAATAQQSQAASAAAMAWNGDPRAKNSQASIVVADLASHWKAWMAAGGPGGPNPRNIMCAVVKGVDGAVKLGFIWFEDLHYGGVASWFLKGDAQFVGAEPMLNNTFNTTGPKLGSGEKWVTLACNDGNFPNFPSGPLTLAQ